MITRTSKLILFAMIISAMIVAGFTVLLWRNAVTAKKASNTRILISAIYVGLPSLMSNELASLIRADHELTPIRRNQRLAEIFESYDHHISRRPSPGAPFRLIDPWGSPLLILPREAAESSLLPKPLLGKNRRFIIWSCGPNRLDEHGNGDDIFFPE